MTKGQRAMAVAMIYPEPKRGEHSEFKNRTGGLGVSKAYLSNARAVLASAPDLAASVLSGTAKLDQAYAEAKRLRDAAGGERAAAGRKPGWRTTEGAGAG
jgi:hypothetical protein